MALSGLKGLTLAGLRNANQRYIEITFISGFHCIHQLIVNYNLWNNLTEYCSCQSMKFTYFRTTRQLRSLMKERVIAVVVSKMSNTVV